MSNDPMQVYLRELAAICEDDAGAFYEEHPEVLERLRQEAFAQRKEAEESNGSP